MKGVILRPSLSYLSQYLVLTNKWCGGQFPLVAGAEREVLLRGRQHEAEGGGAERAHGVHRAA